MKLFQSTSSSRSQTLLQKYLTESGKFQSTSSSRSQTCALCCSSSTNAISIHQLLAEPDHAVNYLPYNVCIFQSTSSSRSQTYINALSGLRGAFQSTSSSRSQTTIYNTNCNLLVISIHQLLAEPDGLVENKFKTMHNFNPLAPRGARQIPQ